MSALVTAESSFDAKDGLLRGPMLVPTVALVGRHVTDDTCDRPVVVGQLVRLFESHAEDRLRAASALHDDRVIQRILRKAAGASFSGDAVGRAGNRDYYHWLHKAIIPYETKRVKSAHGPEGGEEVPDG